MFPTTTLDYRKNYNDILGVTHAQYKNFEAIVCSASVELTH